MMALRVGVGSSCWQIRHRNCCADGGRVPSMPSPALLSVAACVIVQRAGTAGTGGSVFSPLRRGEPVSQCLAARVDAVSRSPAIRDDNSTLRSVGAPQGPPDAPGTPFAFQSRAIRMRPWPISTRLAASRTSSRSSSLRTPQPSWPAALPCSASFRCLRRTRRLRSSDSFWPLRQRCARTAGRRGS